MNHVVNNKRLTETTGGCLIVGVYNQPEFAGELKELDQAMGGHLTQLAKEGISLLPPKKSPLYIRWDNSL
ncbi:hypothetical protein ACPJHQ_19765 [Rossellomorea sp. H39__3]